MSTSDTHSVKLEKTFKKPVADVFRAIAEGRLFQNCGADSGSMKIDFRVGGKYEIEFKQYGFNNFGEFKEIIPNQRISFTWCQSFEEPRTADTLVTLDFKSDGMSTHLSILHTGFKTESGRDDHEGGWTAGSNDLAAEMELGKLDMSRAFEMPLEKLYHTCKSPNSFLGLIGELNGDFQGEAGQSFKIKTERSEVNGKILESVPNQKIVFTWNSSCEGSNGNPSQVTLLFDQEEDDGSSVQLIHEGLANEQMQKSTRAGWEFVFNSLLR
jgi:uncharacterized protein YndB with AHSA1/START domain